MRATAQDRDMAMLVGVDVNRVISMTFIIGSATAAIGGVLIASHIGQINYYIGFIAGIKAFVAAVWGASAAFPVRFWAAWCSDGPKLFHRLYLQ
jgi:branched-chain amino acid transport system permease protein